MFRDLKLVSYLSILGQRSLTVRSSVIPTAARFFAGESVFIKNIDPSATEDDLRQFMERSGQVLSCVVPQSFGQSKGFGIVTYSTEREAQKAIAELNETTFFDKIVYVSEKRELPSDPLKIFVKNLPQSNWEEVKQHFEKFGNITSCKLINRDDAAVSAIIEFESPESVVQALEQKQDNYDGNVVSIAKYVIKKRRTEFVPSSTNVVDLSDATRVYVSNLDMETHFGELKDHFSAVGEVRFVRLLKDKFSGEPKGSAIIQFHDENDARAAIEQLNGSTFRNSRLYVREFRPRTQA